MAREFTRSLANEKVWVITKRYIVERFGMRTPLANNQLANAVFEA